MAQLPSVDGVPDVHELVPPPPASVFWHLPHNPIATILSAAAAEAELPQNGARFGDPTPLPVVQEVPEH